MSSGCDIASLMALFRDLILCYYEINDTDDTDNTDDIDNTHAADACAADDIDTTHDADAADLKNEMYNPLS